MPEVALHIYQRGNNRQDCFRRRNDYLVYLAILRDLCGTRPCALHAYCLMTNHVHLLMTPQDAGVCARLMRDLSGCYASYFNRSYGRTGTLWEGRFASCLVESALYVLGCYRYIELNPVRACMVQQPSQYRWSSHCANVLGEQDNIVRAHPAFLALGLATDPVGWKAARVIAACAAILMLGALVLSFSRGAWLSMAFGLVLMKIGQ